MKLTIFKTEADIEISSSATQLSSAQPFAFNQIPEKAGQGPCSLSRNGLFHQCHHPMYKSTTCEGEFLNDVISGAIELQRRKMRFMANRHCVSKTCSSQNKNSCGCDGFAENRRPQMRVDPANGSNTNLDWEGFIHNRKQALIRRRPNQNFLEAKDYNLMSSGNNWAEKFFNASVQQEERRDMILHFLHPFKNIWHRRLLNGGKRALSRFKCSPLNTVDVIWGC